ncbi:MAG: mersacidin/lichenicidin family type 2 lantibiotic [Ktedonobacteraceae bacterium]|nr:mersacidin/lichenicidin family type 2 lantibiotic [Ktedonobacteraceae bacterium]
MNIDIVRAWKDAEYRESLSSEELAQVPAHPAGEVELAEGDLAGVVGGLSAVVGGGCQSTASTGSCVLLTVCLALSCSLA